MATAQQDSIPRPALYLGLAGLIPFFSMALVTVLTFDELVPRASFALGAYGAVILSFLGGVNWGVRLHDDAALERWMPLVLSVIPSLIAWVALMLSASGMLSALAAALLLQYYLDTRSVREKSMPKWYGKLRLMLTTGAVVSLLVGLIALLA